ncbi:hypothetical protein BC940DRAFT_306996 [Gongronella butleri]|nr:hypothetical protein BC940DRAFT_306996 [Gongronella butleri]
MSQHVASSEAPTGVDHAHNDRRDRDPIMTDDHFSLRFGNPIQEVHDAPVHAVPSFAPSKEAAGHVSAFAASAEDISPPKDAVHATPTHHESPFMTDRDTSSYADFYHKDGRVKELDH